MNWFFISERPIQFIKNITETISVFIKPVIVAHDGKTSEFSLASKQLRPYKSHLIIANSTERKLLQKWQKQK